MKQQDIQKNKLKECSIVFISHSAELAGAERALLDNIDLVLKNNIVVNVIIPRNGPMENELLKRNVSYKIIGMPWWANADNNIKLIEALIWESVLRLTLQLMDIKPDIVFTSTSVISEGAIAAKILGIPHIWNISEFGKEEHNIKYVLNDAERMKFINKYSDKIFFVSKSLKKYYAGKIDNTKSEVFPPIISNIVLAHEKRRFFSLENSIKVVIIGDISFGKGQKDAILATNILLKNNKNVELLIAGNVANVDYYDELQDIISDKKIQNNIKFLGYVDNPLALISQSDVVVVCSMFEGFGRVTVEAMLCRKPVIGANSGATVELVNDNNGMLYTPGNYSELARKIEFFINNPEKIKEFGNNGYNFAKNEFDEEKISARMLKVLEEVQEIDKKNMNKKELLKNIVNVLNHNNKQLQQKDIEINKLNQAIAVMESSKFWKMRNKYLEVKNKIKRKLKKGKKIGNFLDELIRLTKKSIVVLKKRGLLDVWIEFKRYIKSKIIFEKFNPICKDFVFVSGCYLEMPHKYRCEFQKEQLEKQGLTGDVKFFTEVEDDWLKYYDIFILYRLPITDEIKEFIKMAKKLNKLVIFDIDDLVFDNKLVREKHEVEEMDGDERKVYFDGIKRHRETMKLCNYGVASTETIAKYMENYIPTVLVNRNSVPNDLIFRSKKVWKNKKISRLKNKIVLGYFSGSKTHDDDLRLIEDALIKIFNKYPNVVLFLVGPLRLGKKLEKYNNRIVRKNFVKYEKLPELIAQIDINLSPLIVNEFNNGKSEIKYTEAALVKKPTIASDTEAFKYAIRDGETGFIAKNKNEWIEKISKLIENKDLRKKIAVNAYQDVVRNYNTRKMGKLFFNFIDKYRKKKIVYISPSTQISGGVMVIGQHLKYLQKRGYNVSFITQDGEKNLRWLDNFSVPVVPYNYFKNSKSKLLDVAVATLWSTVDAVQKTTAKNKYYLVQNKEHFFYSKKDVNFKRAKRTYSTDINFLTVSKWCQKWLKDDFEKNSQYIPNGISRSVFYKVKSLKTKNNKIRILIEGNPSDSYKNVDESFKIINKLNKNEFEIWFISYGGKPKKWYYYDKFFQKIPYGEMKKYYSSCNIFLKTSILESFSYPPLEMMACGGVCVVAENGGNKEYIKNNYNALTYKLGDIDVAVQKIRELATNEELRKKIIANGLRTVEQRSWNKSVDILEKILNR